MHLTVVWLACRLGQDALVATLDDTEAADLASELVECLLARGGANTRFAFKVVSSSLDANTSTSSNITNSSSTGQRKLLGDASSELWYGYPVNSEINWHSLQNSQADSYGRGRNVGVRANQVLAGALLHQVRRARVDAREMCQSTCDRDKLCSNLATICQMGTRMSSNSTSMDGHVAGIGMDPVFSSKTPLYNTAVASSAWEWYNTSAAAGDVNEFGAPYGFESLGMKGKLVGHLHTYFHMHITLINRVQLLLHRASYGISSFPGYQLVSRQAGTLAGCLVLGQIPQRFRD